MSGMDLTNSGFCLTVGYYEHSDETSSFSKARNFFTSCATPCAKEFVIGKLKC